jgi:predicted O-linked N-acetylglucosamine transferase (SPINDLY family)
LDTLIDLDSITLDVSCEPLGNETCPNSGDVAWLGRDRNGCGIDYFIVDPMFFRIMPSRLLHRENMALTWRPI